MIRASLCPRSALVLATCLCSALACSGDSTGSASNSDAASNTDAASGDATTGPTSGASAPTTTPSSGASETTGATTASTQGSGSSATDQTGESDSDSGSDSGSDSEGVDSCAPGAVQPCYSGPPETEDVGDCAAGTQTCQDDMSWGPCENEQLPQPEDCTLPGDEDCDGEALACTGDGLWARGYGDMYNQHARSIASDPDGDVGVLLKLEGGVATVDLGGGPLGGEGNASARHAVLGKLSGEAEHAWSQSFMFSAHLGEARRVRFDGAGNVYIAGAFNGGVDFGAEGVYGGGSTDVYLAKFDPEGVNLWARGYGDDGGQGISTLAITPDDQVVLCGSFEEQIEFGGDPLFSTGAHDVYLAKIDQDGAHVWSKRFGDGGIQHCYGGHVGDDGGVAIAVYTQGNIKFGPETLEHAGGGDIAFARFDQDGGHEWSRIVGNTGTQALWHAAGHGDGSLVAVGYTGGPTDFGDGLVDTGNNSDVFFVRYDKTGAPLWVNRYLRTGGEQIHSVALDPDGYVLHAGEFTDTIDWGGGPVGNGAQDWDGYAGKLSPDGEHVWTRMLSDADEAYAIQRVLEIASDPSGAVLIIGEFWRSIDVAGIELLTGEDPMYRDVFAAKLAP